MQLVEYFYLDDKNDAFKQLVKLSMVSKNLYNQALYTAINSYENGGKFMFYADLDKKMKTVFNLEGNINYKLLPAQVSQQILRLLDKNIKSFYSAIKDYKNHPEKYKAKPQFPKYLRKDRFLLIYTNQQTKIKDGEIVFPLGLRIKIPKFISIRDKNFNQIRILPVNRYTFKVEIVYTIEEKELKSDNSRYIGIDLGINNFATCVTNIGDRPLIFSGKEIKSYNRWYNKKKSKLSSILNKQHKYNSKQLEKIELKRKFKIEDIFHLYSTRIIQYCLKNNINTLIIGRNKGWKQNCNIGKVNNQKFVQIPFLKFVNKLKYKCKLYGINFIETEESYTSKVDNLVNAPLNETGAIGKRIKRGFYVSSAMSKKNCYITINSDVNGAIGIIRKVFGEVLTEIANSGQLFCPLRLNAHRIKFLNDCYIIFE